MYDSTNAMAKAIARQSEVMHVRLKTRLDKSSLIYTLAINWTGGSTTGGLQVVIDSAALLNITAR